MRTAVISDIHSNLEALKAVLKDIEERGIENIVCLGDVVGYNADPNECTAIVRRMKIPTIMGNHDVVACEREEPLGFNPIAFSAALWTRENLSEENKRFLAGLPAEFMLSGQILCVHGAPSDRDTYVFTVDEAEEQFEILHQRKIHICLFGHTHFPCIFCDGKLLTDGRCNHWSLDPNQYYMINPGSVGQPRDGDCRASYIILDHFEGELGEAQRFNMPTVDFIRVEYDVKEAVEKIVERGLPQYNAERLLIGR